MKTTRAGMSPCWEHADALRAAINSWIEASEATRTFMVRMPLEAGADLEPLNPGYFAEMQDAYERERAARERYIEANNALYDCMERHGMIP